MKLSIIVPVVNESESVNICAQQWAMTAFHDGIRLEIVIADNGSKEEHIKNYDKLGEFHKGFEVKLVRHPYPGQIIPAVAKAYEEVTGEYLLIADAHILYYPDAFASSIKLMEKKDLGAVCMLHNHLGMTPVHDESFIAGDEKMYGDRLGLTYCVEPRYIFMSGQSGTLIRTDWYDKLGRLFPEVFKEVGGGFCAIEDLIPTLTWMFGKKIMSNPEAIYWHLIYKHNADEGKVKGLTDSIAVCHYLKNHEDDWYKWVEDWRGKLDPKIKDKIEEVGKEARAYVAANSKWKYQDLFDKWEEMKNG